MLLCAGRGQPSQRAAALGTSRTTSTHSNLLIMLTVLILLSLSCVWCVIVSYYNIIHHAIILLPYVLLICKSKSFINSEILIYTVIWWYRKETRTLYWRPLPIDGHSMLAQSHMRTRAHRCARVRPRRWLYCTVLWLQTLHATMMARPSLFTINTTTVQTCIVCMSLALLNFLRADQ